MNYTILDLEWNSVFSRRLSGYFNEIIQFGAVKLDENLNQIDSFSTFVLPHEGKKLTDLVMQLTNISNEDVQNGIPFGDAFDRFVAFMGDSVLMTWGDCDIRELVHNYHFFCGTPVLPFQGQYLNLQAYCQHQLGVDPAQQMGLSAAAAALSIDTESVALHRAIDDSLLSAACLRGVYEAGSAAPFFTKMNETFFRRMAFRNKYLTDLNNPLIDQRKLIFYCPECKNTLTVQKPWGPCGKQLGATLWCDACKKRFRAFAQFQQRFDDVRIRRRIVADRSAEEEAESASSVSSS